MEKADNWPSGLKSIPVAGDKPPIDVLCEKIESDPFLVDGSHHARVLVTYPTKLLQPRGGTLLGRIASEFTGKPHGDPEPDSPAGGMTTESHIFSDFSRIREFLHRAKKLLGELGAESMAFTYAAERPRLTS